jgi:hypothetical protein
MVRLSQEAYLLYLKQQSEIFHGILSGQLPTMDLLLAHLIHRAVASGAFRVAGARDRASVSTRVEQDCLVGV